MAVCQIIQCDDAFGRVVNPNSPVELLASGFDAPPGGPAEGPVWWVEGGYLLFSVVNAGKRMKYHPADGLSLDAEDTGEGNGLTRDRQGRLVACEHGNRRVTRREADGSLTVIANSYQGKQLNRPNDVVVKSDGAIYFTDPWTHRPPPNEWDIGISAVYRVSPDLGTITMALRHIHLPNGLAFSPDESLFYLVDSYRKLVWQYSVLPNGLPDLVSEKIFADVGGEEPGFPDGMKVDVEGNVYVGGAGGLWVLDSKGKKLGVIAHGAPLTTNMAFGGDDLRTLYFTTRDSLYAVKTEISGLPVPARVLTPA